MDRDEQVCFLSMVLIWLTSVGTGALLAGLQGAVLFAVVGGAVAPMVAFMVIGTWLVDRQFRETGSGL